VTLSRGIAKRILAAQLALHLIKGRGSWLRPGPSISRRTRIAYLTGEAKTVQALRKHFIGERCWRRQRVVTNSYWTPGRTGLD
jgi:NADPH-dependent ferric siderophore reductase